MVGYMKIDFESIVHAHIYDGNFDFRSLNRRAAPYMVDLYEGIDVDDLVSNGLDGSLAGAYADIGGAEARLIALEASIRAKRPIGAYAIVDRKEDPSIEGDGEIVGAAVFARETIYTSRIRLLLDRSESGVRLFSSWLRADSPEYINPDSVVKKGLEIASFVGLSAVQLAVIQGLQNPSKNLVVVEHEIDPLEHGFVKLAEREVIVEGNQYDSVVYQHGTSQ